MRQGPAPWNRSALLSHWAGHLGLGGAEHHRLQYHWLEAWGSVVARKGVDTVVAAPDGRVAIDPHAVPALATGGTGDVLAGLIAALLAQGSDAFEAAVTGVYVHASAGRLAARGASGLLASEVATAIPRLSWRGCGRWHPTGSRSRSRSRWRRGRGGPYVVTTTASGGE